MAPGAPLPSRVTGPAEAPPVVFLHGFMGSSGDWSEIVPEVEESFRCILLDLPGHGHALDLLDAQYTLEGAADAVVATVKNLGIDRFVLVGYSMGGRIAMVLARKRAEVLRALVVESASPGISDAIERQTRARNDEKLARRLTGMPFRQFLEAWYTQPIFESIVKQPGRLEAIVAARMKNDPHELARAVRGLGVGNQAPLWDDLKAFDMPVLILAGQMDAKYTGMAERMGDLCNAGRVVMFPGAGHNVHREAPQEYARELIAFLQDLS